MKKNLIRIAAVALGLIAVIFIIRWSIVTLMQKKTQAAQMRPVTAGADSALIKNAKDLIRQGRKAEAIKILEETASSKKDPQESCKALILLADIYKDDLNLLKARDCYTIITKEYPAHCDYSDIQKMITELNMQILFSPTPALGGEIYIVKPGDSIAKIAKEFNTTADLIKRSNGLKHDIIKPGMKLKVQKTPFSIVVDKSQSTLTLISGDEVIKVYPVSTGKNNSTPSGTFRIQNKLVNPPWYSPKGVVIPPNSPENALGSRWMGFNIAKPDYGIHGTNDPKSIGYQSTEGCIRMHNSDVEELCSIVPIGAEVTVVD